ncbi:cytochrome P450 [Streptomyces sp. NPDC059688]|uniref:Cytochrome P450 n=1 Tax=Streptomyces sp. 900105245 TaxID=3154379 RepID=A0ABV1TZ20_9ACTN|nr:MULTISPECIES: cytochrome P450 [unclassified Streptomyces]OKJ82003.1 cytochrome [Streptomyces sp. CB01883]ROP54672.1 cytochrome P450 [Streptomyces sp. PanSC9]
MTEDSLVNRITDFANRADPYPLYEELRATPVLHEEEGGPYVLSSYYDIKALLHDPRISSDAANVAASGRDALNDLEETGGLPPSFLRLDPPEHDRLRRIANSGFGPPHRPRRVDNLRGDMAATVTHLIDGFGDARQVDLVDQFAYPFPVTVICRLLGVPREDEPKFRAWVDPLVASLDPDTRQGADEEFLNSLRESRMALGMYLAGLAEQRTKEPQDDLLSDLVRSDGPNGSMTMMEVLSTAVLLLIAGHETTVNLITNGMLTLLRHPDVLRRLREEPGLAVNIVEELLRYEPPVQIVPQRTCIADIEVRGVTIPKGSRIWLMIAAGNRDPERFKNPERFDPDREDIQHLGFGSGIHSCFGAPLARLETQIALTELARRLENPRLVEDPPPYRPNAVLRGPRHLNIAFDDLR